MSEVSVIIPVYNGARFLAETLASIAGQTVPPKEIIVVDDGSVDNSEAVSHNSGVVTKYIANERNSGVCYSRNVGIKLATGSLIAFSDQDDIWDKSKIQHQIDAFNKFPEVNFVFTNFIYSRNAVLDKTDKFAHAPEGWWKDVTLGPALSSIVRLRQPSLSNFLKFQPVFPSTLMVRKALFDKAGVFDVKLGREQSEDLEFLLRCDLVANMAAIQMPLVTIRKHGANYSSDTLATTLSQIRILEYVLEQDERYELFRADIEEQIISRSIEAFHNAFASGELATCLALAEAVPQERRQLKFRIKAAMTRLPTPLERALRRALNI